MADIPLIRFKTYGAKGHSRGSGANTAGGGGTSSGWKKSARWDYSVKDGPVTDMDLGVEHVKDGVALTEHGKRLLKMAGQVQ